jgi:BirA family biotin operon repressor/biotin-[acetyl-CoA-carboxylase] ligase
MIKLEKILENSFVAAVEHYESIASTNDRALAAAKEADVRLPLLIVADSQTAGRGRGSNRWWTGPGSLAFSLLMGRTERRGDTETRGKVPRPPVLTSLAVGVALVDALAPFVPGREIGIHWPNDVMLDGRKLAGVLIEVHADGKQVIGVGINTNNTAADAPSDVRPRVATLRDATRETYDSTELLISLLKPLKERLAELVAKPEQITARTNELCLQRGKQVGVTRGVSSIKGRCLGISALGELIVEQDGLRHAISSGTVTLVE